MTIRYLRIVTKPLLAALPALGLASQPPEPWPSLRAPRPASAPSRPLVAEQYERPTFIRELVSLQWRPGDPVTLYVILPKAVRHPRVALFLYSHPQDAQRFMDDGFCQRIASSGIGAVGFESALTGERYRSRPMREWFVSEMPEAIGSTVHDVQYILDYLGTRADLDTRAFGMFGQGSGGTVALLAGAVDRRLTAIEAVNPWGDWPNWMAGTSLVPNAERKAYLAAAWLSAAASVDPFTRPRMKLLQERLVRFTLVGQDAHLPELAMRTLLEVKPPNADVRRYADAGAYYRSVAGGGGTFEWIARSVYSSK